MSKYEKAGRILYSTLLPLLRLSPSSKKPRVRVVVVNDQNQLLMVRSWLGSQRWSLPGGGVGSGEDEKVAAGREVREETGVTIIITELKNLGQMEHPNSELNMILQGFATKANGHIKRSHFMQRLEIIEAAWFDLDKLPRGRSPIVNEFLSRAGYT